MTIEERNRLINDGTPLVLATARAFAQRLPPSFDADDLIQEGFLGLIDAAAKFDSSKGVPFVAYAFYRVRGAICSSVRRSQWFNATMQEANGETMYDPGATPRNDAELATETRRRALEAAMALLTERERYVITAHFFQNLTLLDAGRQLGVNNSRASQIARKALDKLAALDELRLAE